MNNRIFYTLVILFYSSFLFGQNITDALRYSILDFGGTARAVGSGSALGALGADFSVMSTNPAGLGWIRRSEFIFTPGVTTSTTQSKFLNSSNKGLTEDNRVVFNLSSLGAVITSRPRNTDWTTVNFGIGFNRVADFNQKFYFQGASKGSIVDRFLEIANSDAALDDFESNIAYNAEAIYDIDGDGFYESDFELEPDALINREQTVISKGSISELGMSLAGSYKDIVLFGVTLGVPFVSFTEEKTYLENDDNDEVPFFDDLEYRENLTTTGIGINLKAGIIVRPHQALRLGAAVHTPTAYNLEDNYKSAMTYNYTDGDVFFGQDSTEGLFEYKLRTPWRYIGSAGVVIGRMGFLSGEVEWVDYGKNRFNFDSFTSEERMANDSIVNNLDDAMNIRLGGEVAYDIFRFRAGYGLHYSPFATDDTVNNSFSLGFGIREQSFFMDLAYRRRSFSEGYIPYLTSQAPQQLIDNEVNNDYFLLTFGFKF
ncbi:MAG: hypothetical protein IPJ74_21170 [Saprospiraceae bacterium]|nr:hypothetical protein [Saprospiraceae bacterium]